MSDRLSDYAFELPEATLEAETETWEYVEAVLAHGGSLRGASDRTLRTARVVAWRWPIARSSVAMRASADAVRVVARTRVTGEGSEA